MTSADAVEVYYDPYDFDIDDDPYPIWRRLREEAPLYSNEKYNFYALSRYDDVARDCRTGRSSALGGAPPWTSSSAASEFRRG